MNATEHEIFFHLTHRYGVFNLNPLIVVVGGWRGDVRSRRARVLAVARVVVVAILGRVVGVLFR